MKLSIITITYNNAEGLHRTIQSVQLQTFRDFEHIIVDGGTPVTAFAQGGCIDIIDHKQTGYLAQPYDTRDFNEGIIWCLDNSEKCSQAAIDKVNANFSMRVVAQKYEDIYNEQLVEF